MGAVPTTGNCVAELHDRARLSEWPLFLLVRPVAGEPKRWRSVVSNRLTTTLVSQLDASGFFTRPLCHDDPFVFCLWPQDVLHVRHSKLDLVLPLRRRVGRALFHMLAEAYHTTWASDDTDAPELRDLLPDVRLVRQLPTDVYETR